MNIWIISGKPILSSQTFQKSLLTWWPSFFNCPTKIQIFQLSCFCLTLTPELPPIKFPLVDSGDSRSHRFVVIMPAQSYFTLQKCLIPCLYVQRKPRWTPFTISKQSLVVEIILATFGLTWTILGKRVSKGFCHLNIKLWKAVQSQSPDPFLRRHPVLKASIKRDRLKKAGRK